MPNNIASALSGATGLVGSKLVTKLVEGGHSVRVMSRNTGNAKRRLVDNNIEFFGPQQWADAVKGAYAVVNLAGTESFFEFAHHIYLLVSSSKMTKLSSVGPAPHISHVLQC